MTLPDNASSSAPANAAQAIKVFVLEDYRLIRMGIVSALQGNSAINVVGDAESAEKAFEQLPQCKPDVILMDIGLPGLNGIEATRKIRETQPDMGIIMLTSADDTDQVLAALSAGANAYCLKDIPIERLAGVIEEVNQGAFWLDPNVASAAMAVFQSGAIETTADEPSAAETNPHNLTPKEQETLELLVQGKSNSEIAHDMDISIHTVKAHVSKILEKLSVYDRVQAAVKAVQENLVNSL